MLDPERTDSDVWQHENFMCFSYCSFGHTLKFRFMIYLLIYLPKLFKRIQEHMYKFLKGLDMCYTGTLKTKEGQGTSNITVMLAADLCGPIVQ